MTRRQKLTILLLGIGDAVVCLLLGSAVAVSTLGRPSSTQTVALSTPASPTSTETSRFALPPTWTPTLPFTPSARPTSTPRPLDEGERELMDQVAQEVADLRGLDLSQPVPGFVLTQFQLRQRAMDLFGGEGLEESAHNLVVVLSAFDLLDQDTDLLSHWEVIVSEQVAGFYLVESKEIYLISNDDVENAMGRLLFAHEFTHALQDQNFDLEVMFLEEADAPYDYSDHFIATRALVEGDATLVQWQYAGQYLTLQDFYELYNMATRVSQSGSYSQPRILGELFSFPL